FGWHTHIFDVHGSYSCYGAGLYCGDAGEHFEFRYNTILYTNGTAIKVRGKPAHGAIAENNVFSHYTEWGGYVRDGELVQNALGTNFSALNNTFSADFDDMMVSSVCDFNGDGFPDDFLATGATWWYAPGTGTNRVWRYLHTSAKGLGQLTFGDVNGD